MKEQVLKVALVDRSPILRAGIKALLTGQTYLELVGESATVEELWQHVDSSDVDTLILGLRSPSNGGQDDLAVLQGVSSEVTIVVYVREGDDVICLKALSAGARGFLFDTFTGQEVMDTIRIASRGKIVQLPASAMSELIRAASTESNGNQNRFDHGLVQFKQHEIRLLNELATGEPYKVVASQLGLAPSTVKKYAHQLMVKLGAKNRFDAVLKATALGLVETEY